MSGPTTKLIELTCENCGVVFTRMLREHKKRLKKGRTRTICNANCRKHLAMRPCMACGDATVNPKFCNKSCAAKVNGSLFPKRRAVAVVRTCTVCEDFFSTTLRRLKCPSCFERRKNTPIHSDSKFGQFVKLTTRSKSFHPSWTYARIRALNRQWNSTLLKLPCAKCGYSKHVELAHIRGIATFKRSDLLSEINGPSNVIQLCRNCHWEFDHGLIEVEGLPRLELGTPASVAGALSTKLQAQSGAHRKKRSRKLLVGLRGLEPRSKV